MNMNFAMFDRSRLTTLDSAAMPRKMAPVPAKAIITRLAPLPMPSTTASRRDSITPMKKVKPSRMGTPAAEFLNFSIANMKPNAPARNTIRPMPGVRIRLMPMLMPTQAPSTVGTIDSAKSQ